ncbi:MAG TPA: hypothetical protein VE594_02975 [Nitrososphaeraceae archaeon]|nr:hypothetical protein [Nitrososphaeraceae archaeon]
MSYSIRAREIEILSGKKMNTANYEQESVYVPHSYARKLEFDIVL